MQENLVVKKGDAARRARLGRVCWCSASSGRSPGWSRTSTFPPTFRKISRPPAGPRPRPSRPAPSPPRSRRSSAPRGRTAWASAAPSSAGGISSGASRRRRSRSSATGRSAATSASRVPTLFVVMDCVMSAIGSTANDSGLFRLGHGRDRRHEPRRRGHRGAEHHAHPSRSSSSSRVLTA